MSALRPIPRGARFDPGDLRVGTHIELEHTADRRLARQIAQHHLLEHPLYYRALPGMERELTRVERELEPQRALANFEGVMPSIWGVLSVASCAASAYHGYRRNSSVGWAVVWGLCGAVFPVITPAIAFAQGFGRPR